MVISRWNTRLLTLPLLPEPDRLIMCTYTIHGKTLPGGIVAVR